MKMGDMSTSLVELNSYYGLIVKHDQRIVKMKGRDVNKGGICTFSAILSVVRCAECGTIRFLELETRGSVFSSRSIISREAY